MLMKRVRGRIPLSTNPEHCEPCVIMNLDWHGRNLTSLGLFSSGGESQSRSDIPRLHISASDLIGVVSLLHLSLHVVQSRCYARYQAVAQ